MDAPKVWPQFDQVYKEAAELERYYTMLESIVTMEVLRTQVGIAKPEEAERSLAEQILHESRGKAPPKAQEWLASILEALGLSDEFEDPTIANAPNTVAWLFAPLVDAVRFEKGCRIILDDAEGRKWAERVGSPMFPDVAVCRRISTANWQIQSDASASLIRQIVEWYITTHTNTTWDIITPWMQTASRDILQLLTPFKHMKPMVTEIPVHPEIPTIHSMLQTLEDEYLLLPMYREKADLYFPTKSQWMRFLYHYVSEEGKRMLEFEACKEVVEARVNEWMNADQGIDVTGPCPVKKWEVIWKVTMKDRKNGIVFSDRFATFLTSLDAYDPREGAKLSADTMQAVAFVKKWIGLFLERELRKDTALRIYVDPLYDAIERWMRMSLPPHILQGHLTHRLITLCIQDSPWSLIKRNHGRIIEDCAYRNYDFIREMMKDYDGELQYTRNAQGRPKQSTELQEKPKCPKKKEKETGKVLTLSLEDGLPTPPVSTKPASTKGPTRTSMVVHLGSF